MIDEIERKIREIHRIRLMLATFLNDLDDKLIELQMLFKKQKENEDGER